MFETILKRSVLLLDASQKAALRRALNCYRPEVLIESTCGKGNFIIAALEIFPSIRQVFGLEIQERYVTECKARLLAKLLSRPELKREISSIVWRQGIKHDCAEVMELREENGHWRNGAGEPVNVEYDRIFPLAKSSDLKVHVVTSLRKAVIVPQEAIGDDTTWLERANPRLWKYLAAHSACFDARRSVIYKDKPPFSIFGVGDYSFKPYKVAISGLYKSSHFSLLLPVEGKPVMLDDTCYLLGFNSLGKAAVALGLLNSQPVQDFLKSIVFPDSKRPYTKDVLMRINLQKIASLVSVKSVHHYLSKLEGARLNFEPEDYEFFSSSGLVAEQTMFMMERSPANHTRPRDQTI